MKLSLSPPPFDSYISALLPIVTQTGVFAGLKQHTSLSFSAQLLAYCGLAIGLAALGMLIAAVYNAASLPKDAEAASIIKAARDAARQKRKELGAGRLLWNCVCYYGAIGLLTVSLFYVMHTLEATRHFSLLQYLAWGLATETGAALLIWCWLLAQDYLFVPDTRPNPSC